MNLCQLALAKLHRQGADARTRFTDLRTPLHLACASGNVQFVTQLLGMFATEDDHKTSQQTQHSSGGAAPLYAVVGPYIRETCYQVVFVRLHNLR